MPSNSRGKARGTFDASTRCFFCGADNSEQQRGYGGERGCSSCGKGGLGEPDEETMAYKGKKIVYSREALGGLADKWKTRYCGHFNGAFCEVCTAKDLAALLARVRLAEAEWWGKIKPKFPSEAAIGRERIASLRQAAGEGK